MYERYTPARKRGRPSREPSALREGQPEQPLDGLVDLEPLELARAHPAELPGLRARARDGRFRSPDQEARVEVPVLRLARTRRDSVAIEIDRLRGDGEPRDTALFRRLAQGGAGEVAVAVA